MMDAKNKVARTAVLIALTAFSEAVFLLIAAGLVSSWVPMAQHPFAAKLYPYFQYDVHPERDALLYRFFVLAAVGAWVVIMVLLRKKAQPAVMPPGLHKYMLSSIALNGVLLSAVFKIIVTGNPLWARIVLYAGIGLGLLGRVFFPELVRIMRHAPAAAAAVRATAERLPRGGILDGGMAAVITLFLWPDLKAVLAQVFVRDQFYHIDVMLAAPGWGILNGLVPNVDVTAPYGVVIPWVFAGVSRILGGFDYGQLIALLIAWAVVYFFVLYVLLRKFLNSRCVAAGATFLAIKWQLFHWGVAPMPWAYAMATPLRYGFDVGVLLAVLAYLRSGRTVWLWAGAICTGLTLVWMSDVGVYLMTAWLLFLAVLWYLRVAPAVQLGALAVIPVGTGLLLLSAVTGQAVFKPLYWQHLAEHAALFINGWGALPMTDGLREKQFWAYIMGFAYPCIYAWTFAVAAAMVVCRRQVREFGLLLFVSAYGLGLYHYFIFRSAVSSYCAVSMPVVIVLAFWLARASAGWPVRVRRFARVGAAAGGLLALVTNVFFTYYPSVFGLSGYHYADEKAYYAAQFDVRQDAALIRDLVPPGEGVAILSSFETRLLVEAQRKPLFYYFPLMESSLMGTDRIRHTFLYTQERVKVTLEQLRAADPTYVFIERKLYKAAASSGETGVAALTAAVDQRYDLYKEGVYLLAFKKRSL